MKNRLISMLCALSMLLTCAAPMFVYADEVVKDATVVKNEALPDLPLDPELFIPADGEFVYEMEKATTRDLEVTSIGASATASGGQFLQISAEAHDKKNPGRDHPGQVSVTFAVEEPGSYLVWARIGKNDTCFKALGEGGYGTMTGSTANDSGSTWAWDNLGRVTVLGDTLKVRFRNRYKDVELDKLVITKDVSYNPFDVNDMPTYDTTLFYDLPPITPPEGHPRIYITKENQQELIEKTKMEYFSNLVPSFKKQGDALTMARATAKGSGSADSNVHTYMRSRCYAYSLGGADDEYGLETVQLAIRYMETVDWAGNGSNIARSMGDALWAWALVYDHHHHLLTEDQITYMIARMKYFVHKLECEYPISQTLGKLYGHTNESMIFRDMLAVGAAIYDEDPEVWNIAAGCFFQYICPGRHWQSMSGVHGSGIMYGAGIRIASECYPHFLFMPWGVTEEQLFSENWKGVSAKFIYNRTPDGDLFACGERGPRTGYPEYEAIDSIPFVYAMFADSEYGHLFGAERLRNGIANAGTFASTIWQLIFWDPDRVEEYRDYPMGEDMPLSYLGASPFTHVCARTSWHMGIDSPAAVVVMKGRNYSVENHLRPDNGHFDLWYKGPATVQTACMTGSSGFLSSNGDRQWDRRTIASNCLLVVDPEEVFSNTFYANARDTIIYTNDGGQDLEKYYNSKLADTLEKALELCKLADTEGKYSGPNTLTPKFTYLKTDLTESYGGRRIHKESGRTLKQVLREDYGYKVEAEEVVKLKHFYPSYKEDYYVEPKLSHYDRSMVFIDLNNDDYPAAMVVYDNVTSTNKDFDKNWLLHSTDTMEVEGNITTITNTQATNEYDVYNSKLVNYTLLPEKAVYDVIGGDGKEAWFEGKNWTGGKAKEYYRYSTRWRLELSPAEPSENDVFLNAMYVTDCDRNLPQLPMYREDAPTHVGVTVMDRVVMFARDSEKVNGSFVIDIRDNNNGGVMSCMITDVVPGKWTVVGNGKKQIVEVTEESNTIYFEGLPGSYSFFPAGADAKVDKIEYPKLPKISLGDFYIFGTTDTFFRYNYQPPRIIDGEPYVGAESFYQYYKGSSFRNNNDGTYSIVTHIEYPTGYSMDKEAVFTIGSKEIIMNGEKATIKNAPKLIDGAVYVDPRDFVDASCHSITWNENPQFMKVKDNIAVEEMFARVGCEYRNVLSYKISSYSGYTDSNAPKEMTDLNMETKWATESVGGKQHWAILDFGKEYDLNGVYFTQNHGDQRKQYFSVEVSNDKENWKEVYRGETSGKTEDLQAFRFAGGEGSRYLKFNVYGNTETEYNLIDELWVEKR